MPGDEENGTVTSVQILAPVLKTPKQKGGHDRELHQTWHHIMVMPAYLFMTRSCSTSLSACIRLDTLKMPDHTYREKTRSRIRIVVTMGDFILRVNSSLLNSLKCKQTFAPVISVLKHIWALFRAPFQFSPLLSSHTHTHRHTTISPLV